MQFGWFDLRVLPLRAFQALHVDDKNYSSSLIHVKVSVSVAEAVVSRKMQSKEVSVTKWNSYFASQNCKLKHFIHWFTQFWDKELIE